jgi:hypothetical protein
MGTLQFVPACVLGKIHCGNVGVLHPDIPRSVLGSFCTACDFSTSGEGKVRIDYGDG